MILLPGTFSSWKAKPALAPSRGQLSDFLFGGRGGSESVGQRHTPPELNDLLNR
jgi:hypothetical protein